MSPLRKYDWFEAREFLNSSILTPPPSCIEWPYKRMRSGYGKINVGVNDERLVHRYAYELVHGAVSTDFDICHTCDNPPCFNPNHLFVGTRLDNVTDCIQKNRFIYPHTPSVLSSEQAKEIRETFVIKPKGKRGHGLKYFAEKYGVSMGTISAIVHNRSWKGL